jgi:predicted amidohydrolase
MCYAIGVNRTGEDNNGYQYTGHSQVVDFLGNCMVEPVESESIFYAELNKEKMMLTRQKLGFLNDRDAFEIKE